MEDHSLALIKTAEPERPRRRMGPSVFTAEMSEDSWERTVLTDRVRMVI
jgi:hypothetical protein